MKFLKYSIKIKKINSFDFKKFNFNKKYINILNVEYKFKKTFDKISNNSNKYINDCFKIAIKLLYEKSAFALINGPVSKETLLNRKFNGMTEFIAYKVGCYYKVTMLIYRIKLELH